ncbi:MAG: hypothetical protein KGL39_09230 [Patescibacteria group bacterium]|nr:hypothetical protein [Patescibacteria group bacterium]
MPPGPESLVALLTALGGAQGLPQSPNGMQVGQGSLVALLPRLLQMLSAGQPGGGLAAGGGPPGQQRPAMGGPQGQQPPQQSQISPQVMAIIQMLAQLGLFPHGQPQQQQQKSTPQRQGAI